MEIGCLPLYWLEIFQADRSLNHFLQLSWVFCFNHYFPFPIEGNEGEGRGISSISGQRDSGGRMAQVMPLLCELHWLLVCFQVQFKVFEALHGMAPGYLRDCLIPLELACPTLAGRGGMLRSMMAWLFQLAQQGQGEGLVFHKGFKMWLCLGLQ